MYGGVFAFSKTTWMSTEVSAHGAMFAPEILDARRVGAECGFRPRSVDAGLQNSRSPYLHLG